MLRDNILLTPGRSAVADFIRNYQQSPDADAIHIEGVTYSYAGLMNIALGILRQIKDHHGDRQRFIGLYSDHSIYTYASIIAILLNGSGYVPLNSKSPSERNGLICDDAEIKIILGTKESSSAINKICQCTNSKLTHIVSSMAAPSLAKFAELPIVKAFEDDFVYMMFTSGSTGKPKGVPISHKNICHYLSVMTDYGFYDFKPSDRFLQAIELTFDMSILGIFVAWSVGACVYPVKLDGLAYLNILKLLQDSKITVSYIVPSVVNYAKRYLDAGEINLLSLRYSFFAGESLLVSHVKAWKKSAPHSVIENVFGPTEATNTFLRYRWYETSELEYINGAVSIGHPNPGIATAVISEAGEIVKDGEKGELCVYGAQVAQGYWKDSIKTESSFITLKSSQLPGRWYKTGDLVYLNDNNNYVYLGRRDNQIKINGFRVELGEIEHHIRKITNLESVAVIYNNGGLYAFIQNENEKLNKEFILSKLGEVVPEYMLPKSIAFLDEMPLNINGKVDRNALKNLI